jgi:hypothetical protein
MPVPHENGAPPTLPPPICGDAHAGAGRDSTAALGCGDAHAGAVPVSGLLHQLPICATHRSIPLPTSEFGSHSPVPEPGGCNYEC